MKKLILILLTLNGLGGCVGLAELNDAIAASNYGWEAQGHQAQAPSGYELVLATGLCLDVHGPDVNRNGGRVQVWECHGLGNQRFYFEGDQIVTEAGLCLDVHGPDMHKNGGRVQVWSCHGGPNQRWYYDESDGALVSGTNLCLDIHGPDMNKNGGRAQVWQCHGRGNQQWQPY